MAQELCIPHGVVVSAFAVGTQVASRRAPRDCSTPVATLPWVSQTWIRDWQSSWSSA